MDKLYTDMASIWGAVLASILALIQIRNFIRDRPLIKVTADLAFQSMSGTDPEYGTRCEDKHGNLREAFVQLVVANHGQKPTQIVSVFVEDRDGRMHQIQAAQLPSVIDPRCQISTRIQKEWLDDEKACSLGVLDALGNRHAVDKKHAKNLIAYSRSLPTNRKQYIKRDDPSEPPVWAWQVRDRATITNREDDRTTASSNG